MREPTSVKQGFEFSFIFKVTFINYESDITLTFTLKVLKILGPDFLR